MRGAVYENDNCTWLAEQLGTDAAEISTLCCNYLLAAFIPKEQSKARVAKLTVMEEAAFRARKRPESVA